MTIHCINETVHRVKISAQIHCNNELFNCIYVPFWFSVDIFQQLNQDVYLIKSNKILNLINWHPF